MSPVGKDHWRFLNEIIFLTNKNGIAVNFSSELSTVYEVVGVLLKFVKLVFVLLFPGGWTFSRWRYCCTLDLHSQRAERVLLNHMCHVRPW